MILAEYLCKVKNIGKGIKMKKITSIAIVGFLILSTSAVTNPALAKPTSGSKGGSSSSSGKSGSSSSSSSRSPVTQSSPSISVVVKAPAQTPKPNPTPPYYPPNISVQPKPSPLPTHIQQLKDPVAQKASGSSTYVYQTGSSNPTISTISSSYPVTSSAANKAQTQLGGAKILTFDQTVKKLNDNPSTQKPCFGPGCSGTSPEIKPTQNDTAKAADKLNYTPSSSGQLINGKYNETFGGQTTSSTTFKLNQTVFVDKDKNAKETAKNTNAFIKQGLTDISFNGYASPEGSAANNLILSQNRAITQMNAYRDDLKKQGWTCSGDCGTKDGKVTMINLEGKPVNLTAYGKGEVLPNTGGALGSAFANAALKGCVSNSQSGCNAAFAPMRTTIVTAGKPGTLIKPTDVEKPKDPTIIEKPPIIDGCPPFCGPTRIDPTPGPTTLGGTTRTVSPVTPSGLPEPVVNPASVQPGGTTTTSRLPSTGGVTGGSTSTSTLPSGAGSTTSSGSSSSGGTGTPTSGLGGTAGSSSSGSSLLPPASGFGSTPTLPSGGSTSTPTTGGTSSNPTLAPRFKVS